MGPDAFACCWIVSNDLRPATSTDAGIPGLRYHYQDAVAPATTGITPELNLAAIPHAAVDYSLSFEGNLQVPADGGYTFWLAANEGATLELDGVAMIANRPSILQVCGLAGMAAQSFSASAALAHGLHRLRVTETHSKGKDDFRLLWQGPGFALQPLNPAALTHGLLVSNPSGAD